MYIEREALITELNDIAIDLLKDNSIQCTLAAGTVVDIKDNVVAKQPNADVAPVKHGEWIDNITEWQCSECKYIVQRWNNTPYCPNCSAKMDGKEEK